MTYRDRYHPLIAAVIERVGTSDMKRLRAELREAFPNPPPQYHPYKIWLDEIKVQLGEKPFPKVADRKPSEPKFQPAEGQLDLLGGE